MSNYSIALSGLQNTSSAIDSVSNNIANANTVGYKAGEYLFADQFVRAVNPSDTARVGMGTQTLGVRRALTQGTITNSSNPLDLAISGSGMFRLLKGSGTAGSVDPSAVYYTRNGQFAVDKEGYIVNENGLYLTGFQPTLDGEGITDDLIKNNGLLKMPNSNLPGNETTASRLSALLDSTGNAFTSTANIAFDETQNTYNNKTTQTVFDTDGNAHTLEVYYRRVQDQVLRITSDDVGYVYSPSDAASPNTSQDQSRVTLNKSSVLRVDSAADATATTISQTGTSLILSGDIASKIAVGDRVFVNGIDTNVTVGSSPLPTSSESGGIFQTSLALSTAVTVPPGAQVSFYPPISEKLLKYDPPSATAYSAETKTITIASAVLSSATTSVNQDKITLDLDPNDPDTLTQSQILSLVGMRVFEGTTDTAVTVKAVDASTGVVTLSSAPTFAGGTPNVTFQPPSLGGKRIFLDGKDSGLYVDSVGFSGNNMDLKISGLVEPPANVTAQDYLAAADIRFMSPEDLLNMTLIAPDGTKVTVQGWSNQQGSGHALTSTMARVEVYASLDGNFYESPTSAAAARSNRDIDVQTQGGKRAPVAELKFIGGRNIDALATDPVSGNPQFLTTTKLSTRVTNQAGGTSDLVFDLDLTDTTLQAGAFQITHSSQNGEPLARLTNVTVDNQGRIVGVYGTGKQQYIGQLALVHFDNFEGLMPVGKNAFAATNASGTEHSADGVVVGRAGTGIFGDIKAQALESSNVDLANELVRLMVLQRSYTANSQSMRAFDQTLRDTLQIIS